MLTHKFTVQCASTEQLQIELRFYWCIYTPLTNKLNDNGYNYLDIIIMTKYKKMYYVAKEKPQSRHLNSCRFREDFKEIATIKLRIIKDYFQMENEIVTFVGVHYRGTDYLDHLSRMYNMEVDVSSPSGKLFFVVLYDAGCNNEKIVRFRAFLVSSPRHVFKQVYCYFLVISAQRSLQQRQNRAYWLNISVSE